MKLGLRNTELLLEALGNPHQAYLRVQIAGTNGKGSTAVVLDSICRKAEISTGLYTSPHLVSMTERIKIDGTNISEEVFARNATAVRHTSETLLSKGKIEALPTFFEQVTAIALLAFKEAEVELAILETGLGGRLDSTTAAQAPIVAITQIALDHEEYLGNTIASIAAEKAAIIRRGVEAVVVEDNQPPEVLEVIKQRCNELNIKPSINECAVRIEQVSGDGLFCATFETPVFTYQRLTMGLAGEHQLDNAAVAIQLAETLKAKGLAISHGAISAGVESARHAGRLELISNNFLLDGAHNPAGAHALSEYLERFVKSPITIIFGAMRDKHLDDIAALLFPIADKLILTAINNPRAADIRVLEEIALRYLPPARITLVDSSFEALKVALENTPPTGLICITGSLYLIGEVRPAILQRL
jgi:dihydrofolate synthase/folylpolyglutamate synthase